MMPPLGDDPSNAARSRINKQRLTCRYPVETPHKKFRGQRFGEQGGRVDAAYRVGERDRFVRINQPVFGIGAQGHLLYNAVKIGRESRRERGVQYVENSV